MCMAESFTEYSISKLLMLPTDGKRQATCMTSIQLQNEHPETRNPDALRPSCSLTEQREIHPQTKLLRRSFNRQVKRRGRFLHICTGLKGNRASGPISTTVWDAEHRPRSSSSERDACLGWSPGSRTVVVPPCLWFLSQVQPVEEKNKGGHWNTFTLHMFIQSSSHHPDNCPPGQVTLILLFQCFTFTIVSRNV